MKYMKNRNGVVFPLDLHLLENQALGFTRSDIDGNSEPDDEEPSAFPVLDGNVKSVLAELPGVTDLDTLEQAEQDGQKRKGVLDGIAAERARRDATPSEAATHIPSK